MPPSKRELADFRDSGFTIKQFKKDHLFKSIRTDDPIDVMKRIWAMPTFEVHGLVGGYTGPGIKTVIPPRAEVKISCRLVPNQDPQQDPEAGPRVREAAQSRREDRDREARCGRTRRRPSGPLADAVRDAMKFAFGREPVFVREGGSIGAVVSMEKVLDCPGHVPRPLAARARLPRPERELRLAAGQRRDGGVREVLR